MVAAGSAGRLLRVVRPRLSYLIGNGILKVRDPRISASSLAAFCDKIRAIFGPLHPRKNHGCPRKWEMTHTRGNGQRTFLAYPWPKYRAGFLLARLRVVDTFVTDRSFEEFCKKHGEELKASLIDPPTAKWLVSEYGVSEIRRERRERLSRSKACLGDQNMQVRTEDSRQSILSACPRLSIRRRRGSREIHPISWSPAVEL